MANLQQIIKVTQAQYDILASGGTVGDYTGLNDNFIYLIEDTNTYITSDGGIITGRLVIDNTAGESNNVPYITYNYDEINAFDIRAESGNEPAIWHIDVNHPSEEAEYHIYFPASSGTLATQGWSNSQYQSKLPTTTTANKLLVSTTTSGTVKWSDWSTAGFLKTNTSGVISIDTNSYLTAESDTLATVLTRGNSANKDINLNYHDFYNAGVSKDAFNYSTSQTPNTQYYWFKITPPSAGADRYIICIEGDENYSRNRGIYALDVSKYSTNSYNVSLNCFGNTPSANDAHLLNCAIDASGNVYVQANAAWASYIRFIRHLSTSDTQTYPSVGKAAFGTVNGFTSLKMIQDTGCIRLYNGAIDTSTSNSGFTSIDADKFREGGTVLENKYLGKTAKAADADKLDGQDSTYYLNYDHLTNKPTIPTVNNGTLTIYSGSDAAASFTANQSGNTNLTFKGSGATTVTRTATNEITISSPVVTNTNQTIKVGSTTFGANDAIGLVAGTNITSITADTSAKTITINAKDTTYSEATTSTAGLMSASDKTKLNGIASGAEVNVQSDWNVTDSSSDAFIKNKPTIPAAANNGTLTMKVEGTQKTTFSANQSGNAEFNVTAADLGLSSAMKFVGVSTTDPVASGATVSGVSSYSKGNVVLYKRSGETHYEEYINLDGANTAASWELLGDADSYALVGHTHNYAGSSSAGGAATSANKLNSDAGSAMQPVYFANGIPVATTYSLGKSVPSDAVFTDTNTATAADNILDGSNSGTQVTYAPYSSQQAKLSFDTSSTTPTRTDRLNLNGKFYATEVYAGSTKLTGNTGTVTSVATSGTGLSGGTITTSGTITLDSSSAGNAAANKVVLRNAAGSIQTEKIAVSSGTTTKATMQYNTTDNCVEFVFA